MKNQPIGINPSAGGGQWDTEGLYSGDYSYESADWEVTLPSGQVPNRRLRVLIEARGQRALRSPRGEAHPLAPPHLLEQYNRLCERAGLERKGAKNFLYVDERAT